MRARIVSAGNSKVVRIPKTMLAQAGLEGEVDIEVQGRTLLIRSRRPREGWEAAFSKLGAQTLLDAGTATQLDRDDWQW